MRGNKRILKGGEARHAGRRGGTNLKKGKLSRSAGREIGYLMSRAAPPNKTVLRREGKKIVEQTLETPNLGGEFNEVRLVQK